MESLRTLFLPDSPGFQTYPLTVQNYLSGYETPFTSKQRGFMNSNDTLKQAAEYINEASSIVAFCGSGFSEESGISTFRDPGGLWDQLDPMEVGTAQGLIRTLETRSDLLRPIFLNILDSFLSAEPNGGHFALAELEKMGKLLGVITQNVDNLHQEAGGVSVVEMHGNLFRMRCLGCASTAMVERKPYVRKVREKLNALSSFGISELMTLAETCLSCGNIMRPDVVMFGEAVQCIEQSFEMVKKADLVLVLGTSGVVYPAASIPMEGKRSGARVIEINPNENAYSQLTDLFIDQKTGQSLPLIVKMMKEAG